MSQENDDKNLSKIQEEIMKSMDKEQMEEDEVEEKSSQLAAALLMNPIVKANINGVVYTLKYRIVNSRKIENKKSVNVRYIVLIAANDIKFKIAGNKYTPFTANAEIIEEMSMQENLRGIINAFIRHITGNVKPEEIN